MRYKHLIIAAKDTHGVSFRDISHTQRKFCCILGILCVGFFTRIPHVIAESSWNPTLLVNTTATQVIDDMSSADLSLQFGSTLNKSLTYDRTASRFTFDAPLHISGSLEVTGTMSGDALYVPRALSGAGLVNCSTESTDKLLWNSTTEQFSCGADQTGVGGGLTQSDADARYANQAGDTMTGALRINVTGGSQSTLGLRVNNTASGAHIHAEQTLTSSGQLIVEGNLTFGDALADAITVNAGTWTFANDTNFVLSGGNNGLSFDTNTLSIDASANRVGLGTTTPDAELETIGTMSGTSLTVGSLKNCDTIDTNGNGVLSCGTDAGGAGGISQTDGDSRYVKRSGATMTGALTIDLDGGNTGTGLILREKAYLGSGATLSGSLVLKERNDPPATASGTLGVYAKNYAGRMMLKGIGPSGLDYPYQPSIFNSNIAMFYPANSTTVGTVDGWTFTSAGTVSHPAIASTNLQTSIRRTQWASATTASAVGGIFTAQTNCWRGNAAGRGGFFFFARFSQLISTNGARAFVGLSDSTAHIVALEPSADTNIIGVGYDAADAPGNWRLMYNDASGVATEVDLGSGAARNTTDVYDLYIFAPANASSVTVRVVNQTTNTVVLNNLVITTDLPSSTTFLRVHAGGGPAATAVAQNFQLARLYLETDF